MARTTQEIYNSIIAEKDTLSSLDGLTPAQDTAAGLLASLSSGSKVAIWRLWAWVVAAAMHALEVMWDAFRAEVTSIVNAAKYGSLGWYVQEAKRFQLGDVLTLVDNFPTYANIDTAAQIVTHASAIEDAGTVFLKVAKTTGGNLVALSGAELTAFQGYIFQIKPAGVQVIASSLNADTLRLTATIRYNGILPSADVLAGVEAAIEAYLAALPFDATFRRLALEDALQAVPGVIGIEIAQMQGYQGLLGTTFTQTYVAQAGYMTYDAQNSTLTLTPA